MNTLVFETQPISTSRLSTPPSSRGPSRGLRWQWSTFALVPLASGAMLFVVSLGVGQLPVLPLVLAAVGVAHLAGGSRSHR